MFSLSFPFQQPAFVPNMASLMARVLRPQTTRSLGAGAMRFSSVPQTHVGVYGGLKDQDRIFTNIYGEHDSSIDGALKRVGSGKRVIVPVYLRLHEG